MDPYVGEIRMIGCNWEPVGWVLCDGRLLSTERYQLLYQLIGTTYGGDGQMSFGVPDLRGRVAVDIGPGLIPGEPGGTETVALRANAIPSHNHTLMASGKTGSTSDPAGALTATLGGGALAYGTIEPGAIDPSAIANAGGGEAHENRQPYLAVNFIICTDGVVPRPGE